MKYRNKYKFFYRRIKIEIIINLYKYLLIMFINIIFIDVLKFNFYHIYILFKIKYQSNYIR